MRSLRIILPTLVLILVPGPGLASIKEEVNLGLAQEDLSAAEVRLAEAVSRREAIEPRLEAGQAWASSLDNKAEGAGVAADHAEQRMVDQRERALEEVQAQQADYRDERDWREAEETVGIALAVALGLAALILAFWRPLSAAPPVRWLAKVGFEPALLFWPAVGCIVGGVLLGGTLGALLAAAGPTLFVLLGLAVRSQRLGQAEEENEWTLGKHGSRLYPWPSVALVLLLAVGGAILAIVPADAERPDISKGVQLLAAQAEPDPTDDPTVAVSQLQDRASRLTVRANDAAYRVEGVEEELASAENVVYRARRDMRSASQDVADWQRLVARPDPRPLFGNVAGGGAGGLGSGYDPYEQAYDGYDPPELGNPYDSYDTPYPDRDCEDYSGPVYGVGNDPYGLDADNDGVGCE